jgi:hypothetical protein
MSRLNFRTPEQREALFPTHKVTKMSNPWMIIGLPVLLCLYLAFGLIGYARSQGIDAAETTDDRNGGMIDNEVGDGDDHSWSKGTEQFPDQESCLKTSSGAERKAGIECHPTAGDQRKPPGRTTAMIDAQQCLIGDDGPADCSEQWAQYSKITGEPMSGFHHTHDDCMEEEMPKVSFPYRSECRRPKDQPTTIDDSGYK